MNSDRTSFDLVSSLYLQKKEALSLDIQKLELKFIIDNILSEYPLISSSSNLKKIMRHFTVAIASALLGALWVSMWYASGDSCWGIAHSCHFSVSQANLTFISVGLLSIYFSSLELLAFLTGRGPATLFSEFSEMAKKTRNLKLGIILGGIVLAGYGMLVINITIVPCPLSGCTFWTPWEAFGNDYILFYFGLCLIAAGSTILAKPPIKPDHLRLEPNKISIQ